MPFPLLAAGIAALAPSIISGIGSLFGAGKREEAEKLRRQAMEQYNIELPPLEQLVAETQQDSAFGAADPRTRDAQMEVLSEMMGRARAGGLNDTDKARTLEMQSGLASQERGQREAIQQSIAARGRSGGGSEYAAMLANQQGTADRASQQGMDINAMAQQSALRSLEGAGQQAGHVRGQDYQAAAAQDSVNRFNAGQRQGTNVFNAGQRQQRFGNQLGLANARAGALRGQANVLEGHADNQQGGWDAVGQAAGQLANGYGQYQMYDDWMNRGLKKGGV